MNRRDFIRGLALIAAGASAMPEQISFFERYYEANAPRLAEGLIAIDEVTISGLAKKSTRILFSLYKEDEEVQTWAINAFGGILRWVAAPDQKIITPMARWKISSPDIEDVFDTIVGRVSYVNQDLVRHYAPLSIGRIDAPIV